MPAPRATPNPRFVSVYDWLCLREDSLDIYWAVTWTEIVSVPESRVLGSAGLHPARVLGGIFRSARTLGKGR